MDAGEARGRRACLRCGGWTTDTVLADWRQSRCGECGYGWAVFADGTARRNTGVFGAAWYGEVPAGALLAEESREG